MKEFARSLNITPENFRLYLEKIDFIEIKDCENREYIVMDKRLKRIDKWFGIGYLFQVLQDRTTNEYCVWSNYSMDCLSWNEIIDILTLIKNYSKEYLSDYEKKLKREKNE
jgi:hypothetical protein